MTAAGVLEDCPQINAIRSQFQNKNYKKGKGKGNQKGQSNDYNNQNKNKNSDNNQNPKPKSKAAGKKFKYTPGKTKCVWCDSVDHRDDDCKTKGNGKWDTKTCNGCGGVAHPTQKCPNPIKKKK